MILSGILTLIIVAVVFLASNEGAWGAALILVSTIFAGLLAMNVYEPIAAFLQTVFPEGYCDFVALIGTFAIGVSLIRVLVDYLAPTNIELPALVYDISRFGFGAMAGYVTMAFLCAALHTAPLPREIPAIGFTPEGNNFFDVLAPDRQWLGFTQYFSERVMGSDQPFDGPTYSGIPNAEASFKGATPARWPSFILRYAAKRDLYARAGRPARGFAQPGAEPSKTGQPAQPSGGF